MADTPSAQKSTGTRAVLGRALEQSSLVVALRAPFREDARTRQTARWLSETVRNSFIYRWLTKEPEPEVFVIDLRETWTVGPVIRLLDHVIVGVIPIWNESTFKRGFDLLALQLDHATETRSGQLLIKFLEPPAPPEETNESDGGQVRSDHEE
ncbi:hypothetical protein [Halorarum salinum]|uniref:Uncharacterized protein n=1 Tax=Halorarum salinum TaxID=2743089 RepID=A0A7D5L843_9EURY|nr:hypothetical protein [Halobaculum salinum]QLG60231.1 hypothetical protein HUG12_04845 [Halobaculum salinum]